MNLVLRGHHPVAAPLSLSGVVLSALDARHLAVVGQELADVDRGGRRAARVLVVAPAVSALRRGLAPGEVGAVALGRASAHVARRPKGPDRQAKVYVLMRGGH